MELPQSCDKPPKYSEQPTEWILVIIILQNYSHPLHMPSTAEKKAPVLLYIQHHRRSENSYTTKQCYAWAIRCFRTNTGLNPLKSPEQNGRHFAEDIYECTFQNKNYCISLFWFKFQWSWFLMFLIQNSLELIPMGPIDKGSALLCLMAWCRTGD